MSDFKLFSEMTHEEKVEDITIFAEEVLNEVEYDEYDYNDSAYICIIEDMLGAYNKKNPGLNLRGAYELDCVVQDVEVLENCGEHIAIVTVEIPADDCSVLDGEPIIGFDVVARFYVDMIDEESNWMQEEYFRDAKGNIDYNKTFIEG